MNARTFFTEQKLNRRWFPPAIEFVVERLVLGSVAALIINQGMA